MTNKDSFRFSIQFNLKNENHKKAYKILSDVNKGSKSEFCINCILNKQDERHEIKDLIESTIKKCLKNIQISEPSKVTGNDDVDTEIMDGVMDFLDGL